MDSYPYLLFEHYNIYMYIDDITSFGDTVIYMYCLGILVYIAMRHLKM